MKSIFVNLNEDFDCYHNRVLTTKSTFQESNDYIPVFDSIIPEEYARTQHYFPFSDDVYIRNMK